MKIAILSDIHGNSDALMSVLTDIKKIKIKHLLIAGDFVGYYYNIKKVLNLLKKWEVNAIGGNHETLLLNWSENKNREPILKKYGSGIEIAYGQLNREKRQWLINLPKEKEFMVDNKTVLLCHGSPWDENEYIYPDCEQDKLNAIFSLQKDVVIYGHTHYPVVHNNQSQLIINPGSVGQTRDRKPGACWALWDTKSNHIELKRTPYNTEKLIRQCQVNDPNLPYLQTVLKRTNAN